MSWYRSVLIVGVVGLFSSANADTIYVDVDNCPGPGSGTEGDPYCSIQAGIDNAVDTDEIVVAPGTYYENINFMGKAITLRSSGGPEVTVIDGGGLLTVVLCVSGEGPDTVLDGFTITNGSLFWGGGMRNSLSSPTVANCAFIGNEAIMGGGGMYTDGGNPTVTNCTFIGNSAEGGGGMLNYDSNPTVTNCTFEGNNAEVNGGGMLNNNNSSPTVTGCAFVGNSAGQGGAMWNASNSIPAVTDSTFCGSHPDQIHGLASLDGQIEMATFCPIPACPADANGDGEVSVLDFLAMLAGWGLCP